MSDSAGSLWRRRMRDLARGRGLPHEPLFAPLIFAVASQIDAVSPANMVVDATKLRKNLGELRRFLGLSVSTVAVPGTFELETLGAKLSDQWPPRLQSLPPALEDGVEPLPALSNRRLAASLGAVAQMKAERDDPVLIAAFSGPATLLDSIRAAGSEISAETAYECFGRLLATLARMYGEAGVHVFQVHEMVVPTQEDRAYWNSAMLTAGNVARFHKVLPVFVVDDANTFPGPANYLTCTAQTQHTVEAERACGRAWSADPVEWAGMPAPQPQERLLTTIGEVAPDQPIAELKRHMERTGLPQPQSHC